MIILGKKVISFCSNNYFGVIKRPEILNAAKKAIDLYGIGTCESRRLGGDLMLLETLERKIADFKHGESAVIFSSGLMTNISVIPSLSDFQFYYQLFFNYPKSQSDRPTVIFSDICNHRSIQMGIKLSRGELVTYEHCNVDDLEQKMILHKDKNMLIITDGVFSMDGDLAPLDKIAALAESHGALLMVDDAHGTGIYGATGRGTAEHFGVSDKVHINMGTFSKTFGGLGGFIVADSSIVKMIKYTSSGYYFTSSLPAEQAAGLIEAIDIVEREPELRKKLWENVAKIIVGVKKIGLDIPDRWSHIIPIMVYDEHLAFKAEKYLLENGILCASVQPPAVKSGQARLRITVNASHTAEHISKLLVVLENMTRELNIQVNPVSENCILKKLGPLPG